MNYQNKLDKVKPIIKRLLDCGNGPIFLDLGQIDSEGVRISYFPPGENAAEALRMAMSICPKMVKGGANSMEGTSVDFITICLFDVTRCEIVGYKKIVKPKMIQDGTEEIDEPIYECKSVLVTS